MEKKRNPVDISSCSYRTWLDKWDKIDDRKIEQEFDIENKVAYAYESFQKGIFKHVPILDGTDDNFYL